ncbi:hypothetical protein D9M73_244060 [compost metagenome]
MSGVAVVSILIVSTVNSELGSRDFSALFGMGSKSNENSKVFKSFVSLAVSVLILSSGLAESTSVVFCSNEKLNSRGSTSTAGSCFTGV